LSETEFIPKIEKIASENDDSIYVDKDLSISKSQNRLKFEYLVSETAKLIEIKENEDILDFQVFDKKIALLLIEKEILKLVYVSEISGELNQNSITLL
jgi:hypothetical protein